jgi:sugar phosphate permease
VALICMNSEGAVLDWAALYLRQELGADIATAGWAFAGFSGAMALDALRRRWHARSFRGCYDLSRVYP